MPNTIGGALPIADIFSRRWFLEIPEYQRDYAWDANESLQLIKDFQEELKLHSQSQTEPSYYLGTIILALVDQPSRSGDLATAEIVDGQQRLATLTIFMACLRDLQPQGARKDALDRLITSPHQTPPTPSKFVLSLRGFDGEFLCKSVQYDGATLLSVRRKATTRRAIVAVREAIQKFLTKLGPSERDALADFIMAACRVAVVTTRNRDQAWRIFGRVNQRGKRLRTSDILKAVIIGALPQSVRPHYVAMWDKWKQALGADFDGEVVGRRYLFSYIAELGGREGNILDSVIAQIQHHGAAAFMDNVFEPVARAFVTVNKQQFNDGTDAQRQQIAASLKQLSWQPDDGWIIVAILLIHRLSTPIS